MVSDEALKKLQEQIAAWPMERRFVVQQLIEDYRRNREDLRAYEATRLMPEQINDLASVREIPPEAEYAINKHADSIIERLDKLLAQTDDDVRLRELAEADKDGRLVVLPCKVGDTVYRLFAGNPDNPVIATLKINTVAEAVKLIGKMGMHKYIGTFLTREEAEKALEAMEDV
jgi:hypothetical protein